MRILLVSHAFPPVGGPGVQRAAKLAKHLVALGHAVDVLAAPAWTHPRRDSSLAATLPAAVRVIRPPSVEPAWLLHRFGLISFERGKFPVVDGAGSGPSAAKTPLVRRLLRDLAECAECALMSPDIHAGWLPFAIPAAAALAALRRPDVTLATGPPFSPFLVPLALKRAFGIPFLLDYRDAWALNPYRVRRRGVKFRANARLEARLLAEAAFAVFVTRHMLDDHARAHPHLAGRFRLIPNGFDPDDFESAAPAPRPRDGRFRLAYVGTFTESRTPAPFLRAVARLAATAPDLARRLDLRFVGDTGEAAPRLARELGLSALCTFTGYLPHHRSVGELLAADALLLVTGRDPSEVTGKVFEYLRAGKPILALTHPNGSLSAILKETRAGLVACRVDEGEIADKLALILSGAYRRDPDPARIAAYSRLEQARTFAALMREAAGGGGS